MTDRKEGAEGHYQLCHGLNCPCYKEGVSMTDNVLTNREITFDFVNVEDEPLSKTYYVLLVLAFILFAGLVYLTFSLYGSK